MSGLITSQKRPRNLSWYHAGPLLFGDWGTSRLYVLGLAWAGTKLASPIYLLALSCLMITVAWAYTIVCEKFPEGGGVYSAARQIHPVLSVIGGTLLLADYIVTAALSSVDAFHYFGVPDNQRWVMFACCAGTFFVLGALNWFGARSAGTFALFIALAAIALSLVIGLMSLPFLPAGLKSIEWGSVPLPDRWVHFTGIILALSGVEAVANMTGIMKEPVSKTSKKTIWPVLAEVILLNLVFSVTLLGVLATADLARLGGEHAVEATAMKVIAHETGTHWFGPTGGAIIANTAAIVFAFLLLSAVNTVIGGMISVYYSMSRDGELPAKLAVLNYSGVPVIPVVLACVAPALVLLFTTDLEQLSHLYAIGVCGAISLNLVCCAINRKLDISKGQRTGLWIVGSFMTLIWLTIAATKYWALLFAAVLVGIVLAGRALAIRTRRLREARSLPEPDTGWLAELKRDPWPMDASRPRILLAARGRWQAEFAIARAAREKATLFAIYVRTLRVLDYDPTHVPRIEDDPAAQEALGTIATLAHRHRVPLVPIYVASPDIVEEILDAAATYGCSTIIMGKTRRSLFARKIEGDVVSRVAASLPDGVALITRDANPYDGPELKEPSTPPTPTPPPAPPLPSVDHE